MDVIRLLDLDNASINEFELRVTPPYLAVSHAWSERIFPPQVAVESSWGWKAIRHTVSQRYKHVKYCWIDTICILQDDPEDKQRQIPLMGTVFGQAVAVLILLSCTIGLEQQEVSNITTALAPAVHMHLDESYNVYSERWGRLPDRLRIVKCMSMLSRFTKTAWASRIWTLQEYILAQEIVWIGLDMIPLVVDDHLFVAIPDICDTLSISECIGGQFSMLYSHFSGMVNCRLGRIDQTRVMELLGTRTATVPVDEIYGAMAASGVNIHPIASEIREKVWRIWWKEAVMQGNVRWILLPVPAERQIDSASIGHNCIEPNFKIRHLLSASSALDTVKPLGSVSMEDSGCVTLEGRMIGTLTAQHRFGRILLTSAGWLQRELTMILFGARNKRLCIAVADSFGGGRYSTEQRLLIAKVLFRNFRRAIIAVGKGTEDSFGALRYGRLEETVWRDFMELQMGQSICVNESVAYLGKLKSKLGSKMVCIGSDQTLKLGEKFDVLDLGAQSIDKRRVLLIGRKISTSPQHGHWHKVAMTLPSQFKHEDRLERLPLDTIRVGGDCCTQRIRESHESIQMPTMLARKRLTNRELFSTERLAKILRCERYAKSPRLSKKTVSFRWRCFSDERAEVAE